VKSIFFSEIEKVLEYKYGSQMAKFIKNTRTSIRKVCTLPALLLNFSTREKTKSNASGMLPILKNYSVSTDKFKIV
jgi:hypothetical protein